MPDRSSLLTRVDGEIFYADYYNDLVAAIKEISATRNRGDLIYQGVSGKETRLPIGSAGQILLSNGIDPIWHSVGFVDPEWFGAVYKDSPTAPEAVSNYTALMNACNQASPAGQVLIIRGKLGISQQFDLPPGLAVAAPITAVWTGAWSTSIGGWIFDAGILDRRTLVRWGKINQQERHYNSRLTGVGLYSPNDKVCVLDIKSNSVSTAIAGGSSAFATRTGTLDHVTMVGAGHIWQWGPWTYRNSSFNVRVDSKRYWMHQMIYYNGRILYCIQSGVSGPAAPAVMPSVMYDTVTEPASTHTARANSTAVSLNNIRKTSTGRLLICMQAGTTAGSEPVSMSTPAISRATDYVPGDLRTNAEGTALFRCVSAGTTHATTQPAGMSVESLGTIYTDGTVSWVCTTWMYSRIQDNNVIWQGVIPCVWEDWGVGICPIRVSNTAYTVNQYMTAKGRRMRCTIAGTTAVSEPASYKTSDDGTIILDGTATFIDEGISPAVDWWEMQADGFVVNHLAVYGIGNLAKVGLCMIGANAGDATMMTNSLFAGCCPVNEAMIWLDGGFTVFDGCYAGGDGTSTRSFIRHNNITATELRLCQSEKLRFTYETPDGAAQSALSTVQFYNCMFDDDVYIGIPRRVRFWGCYWNTSSVAGEGAKLYVATGADVGGDNNYFYDDRSIIAIGGTWAFTSMKFTRGDNASTTNGVYQVNECIVLKGQFSATKPSEANVIQEGRNSSLTRANSVTTTAVGSYYQNAAGTHTFLCTAKIGTGMTAGSEPSGITTPTIGSLYYDGADGSNGVYFRCVNTTPKFKRIQVFGDILSATTLGSVVRKMEVFDAAGTSMGFVPIYNTIT